MIPDRYNIYLRKIKINKKNPNIWNEEKEEERKKAMKKVQGKKKTI